MFSFLSHYSLFGNRLEAASCGELDMIFKTRNFRLLKDYHFIACDKFPSYGSDILPYLKWKGKFMCSDEIKNLFIECSSKDKEIYEEIKNLIEHNFQPGFKLDFEDVASIVEKNDPEKLNFMIAYGMRYYEVIESHWSNSERYQYPVVYGRYMNYKKYKGLCIGEIAIDLFASKKIDERTLASVLKNFVKPEFQSYCFLKSIELQSLPAFCLCVQFLSHADLYEIPDGKNLSIFSYLVKNRKMEYLDILKRNLTGISKEIFIISLQQNGIKV